MQSGTVRMSEHMKLKYDYCSRGPLHLRVDEEEAAQRDAGVLQQHAVLGCQLLQQARRTMSGTAPTMQ